MEFWPSCGPHRHGFLTADALGTTLLSITQGRRAVPLDPLNPRSHEALGAALYYARRYDEAIAAWTRALSLDPKDSLTAGERGYAHIALGQYDAALRTCNVVDCARCATETLRGHQGLVGPSFSESGCRTLRSIICASLRMRLISSSQW
jgi:hypothetical protein